MAVNPPRSTLHDVPAQSLADLRQGSSIMNRLGLGGAKRDNLKVAENCGHAMHEWPFDRAASAVSTAVGVLQEQAGSEGSSAA